MSLSTYTHTHTNIVSQITRSITRGLDTLTLELLKKHRHALSKKDYHHILMRAINARRLLYAVVKTIIYDTPYADYLKEHREIAYDRLDTVLYVACMDGYYDTADLMMRDERNATLLKNVPYIKELIGDLVEQKRTDILVLLISRVEQMNTDRITNIALCHGCIFAIYNQDIEAFRFIMAHRLMGSNVLTDSSIYSRFLDDRPMLEMMLKDPDLRTKYNPATFNNYAVRYFSSKRDHDCVRMLEQDERVGLFTDVT